MADFMSTWLVHEVSRYMAKFFGVFMKMFPAFELGPRGSEAGALP